MLQLQNVEFPKAQDTKGVEIVATMDTFLAPLVERLALAHPEWQFKSHYCRKYYTPSGDAEFAMVVERVAVVDKYEKLGELGYDHVSRGKRFYVSNHRTEKMRERGSGMKTIHLDKACKHVEKFFGRMNHDEKIEQAMSQATQVVWQARNGATYPVNGAWNIVNDIAKDFVVANLDKFKAFINESNANTLVPISRAIAEVEKLPELMAEMRGVNTIDEMWRNNKATLVLLDGMNYIVKHANQVEVKTSEELPEYVRRGVGMLKLVEPQHAISNIGIRVNDTTFVVIPNNVKE